MGSPRLDKTIYQGPSLTHSAATTDPCFQTVEVDEITECYRIVQRLGHGTYGQVLLAQDKITGKPLALKLVRKDRTKIQAFLMELSLSISLSENLGFITTYPIFINTMDYYVMTQELAPAGTLHHLIQSECHSGFLWFLQVGLPEDVVKRCAMQISRALDFMHEKGLVHRDLKPDNVLLMDKDCHQIKLRDFGLTQAVGSLVGSMSHIIPYMSPELCDLRDGEYLILFPGIDTWAFGVLLFVILTGYFPWRRAIHADKMYRDYVSWQSSPSHFPPPVVWREFTPEAITMLSQLLTQDPTSRHSVLSVLNYLNFPWKADVYEVGDTDEEQFQVVNVPGEEETTPCAAIEENNPVFMVLEEHFTLTLGSEVEI
ncbi:serine/threonine-protein kinase SBK1-like [Engystomops pustulosus]|uniref:serine/threonine-protein kinase SBK1-like n=1 Tax=Engystomops pustulosus TaxID=76066 RepID=UPI003AFA4C39